MIQQIIKANRKDNGFTIVELLVVIVVIGILAAITIVSYTGVTTRAKAAQAQANASSVQSVVEAYATDVNNNGYPTTAAVLTGWVTGVTKVPAGLTVQQATQNSPATGNGQTTIGYRPAGAAAPHTGACIAWYDFGTSTIKYIFTGTATAADFTVAAPTCS